MQYPQSKTRPWAHQVRAWQMAYQHRNFMLALDMGAGKSKCAVDFCTGTAAETTLILCPKAVIDVWPKQFRIHSARNVNLITLTKGTVKQKADQVRRAYKMLQMRGTPLVVVVNYESAWRPGLGPDYNSKNKRVDDGALLKINWDLVIADESHRFKSPSSRISKFMFELAERSNSRLCLTGTPMPNAPEEIWAQYRFLDVNVFGTSYYRWRARYCQMGGFERREVVGYRNEEELSRKIASRMLRVTKEECLDLPPTIHEHLEVELGAKAMRIYRELTDELVTLLDAGEITVQNALTKLLRLQQITGGTVGVDNGNTVRVDKAKQDALAELLSDLGPQEPVVVFGRFRADLDAIHEACNATGRTSLELSGRRRELAAWQNGEANVLAIQISSGGLGIDCTRAAYCVYYSLGYSLGDYEQSLARVHRPGQRRPVAYYHIIAKDTVDGQVYEALSSKSNVVRKVLDGMGK